MSDNPKRPKTRGDCVNGPRPCPGFGCKYHLLTTVDENGTIWLHPDAREGGRKSVAEWGPNLSESDTQQLLDLMDTHETCLLDRADDGGSPVTAVAETLGYSERYVYKISVVAEELRERAHNMGKPGSRLVRLMRAVAAFRRRTDGARPRSVKALRRQWLGLKREERPALAAGWREELGWGEG